MRGDKINGAPKGVAGDRICCAVRPGMAGDNNRDSEAIAATRRQSSSPGQQQGAKERRLQKYSHTSRVSQRDDDSRNSPADEAFELESL